MKHRTSSQNPVERIDVPGLIRQASVRVGLDQLARQGKKYVTLLSKEKMADLIHRAAKTIVDRYRAEEEGLSGVPSEQIDADARVEFGELVRQYELADQARSDVDRSRQRLVDELTGLRQEVARQKENKKTESVIAAGFEAFAGELDRHVVQVYERRRLILDHAGSPEEGAELREVEEILGAIVERIVSAERERFELWGGRTREVALLHRRIEKLEEHIATMEASFQTLADSKAFSGQQVRNVLVQLGLVGEDKYYGKKKEMLRVVLDANKDLKIKAADLKRRRITLSASDRRVAV